MKSTSTSHVCKNGKQKKQMIKLLLIITAIINIAVYTARNSYHAHTKL